MGAKRYSAARALSDTAHYLDFCFIVGPSANPDFLLINEVTMKSKHSLIATIAMVISATVVSAAPDGKWTLTINSSRPWQMDVAVKNNTPQVLSAHGITPEGIVVRKATDDRLQFDATIAKQGSCSSGSVMKFNLKFKNGAYHSGSVNGNCIGFPRFRARLTTK